MIKLDVASHINLIESVRRRETKESYMVKSEATQAKIEERLDREKYDVRVVIINDDLEQVKLIPHSGVDGEFLLSSAKGTLNLYEVYFARGHGKIGSTLLSNTTVHSLDDLLQEDSGLTQEAREDLAVKWI